MPKPSSQAPFYLRGVLSICHKNPKSIDLSDLPQPSVAVGGGTSEDMCCPAGQYWYMSAYVANVQGCQDCPPRSRATQGGLYCEDTSRHRHRGRKNAKHHDGQHRRKAKSLIHHAIKKHKLHGTGKNKKREEIKKKH
jgi:hypothetical protein